LAAISAAHICAPIAGKKREVYEEKETDAHIGAQLVADAFSHSMDEALIISGDADYVPAIHIVPRC